MKAVEIVRTTRSLLPAELVVEPGPRCGPVDGSKVPLVLAPRLPAAGSWLAVTLAYRRCPNALELMTH